MPVSEATNVQSTAPAAAPGLDGWADRFFERLEDLWQRLWVAWTGVVRAGRAQGWRFSAIGIAAGGAILVLVRLMVAAGVSSSSWWLRIGVVVLAMLVLALVLNLMLKWYVRHKAEPDDQFPLLAALILSMLAIGLSVVAFAGTADLFWLAGHAAPPSDATPSAPSYYAVELSYLWNLVASVPLLAIPRRFDWADPQPLIGIAAGTVLLIFKITLVIPLVRVGQAVYQAITDRWFRTHTRRQSTLGLVNRDLRDWDEWTGPPALIRPWSPATTLHTGPARRQRRRWQTGEHTTVSRQFGIALLAVGAVVLTGEMERLTGLLPDQLSPQVSETAAAVLPWLVAFWLVRRWVWTVPRRATDIVGDSITGAILVCVAWIVQLMCATAAVIGLLVQRGVARLVPAPTAGDEAREMLVLLAWRLCDALPGPDIPATLHWVEPGTVVGTATAVTELIFLLSAGALVVFPVALALRVWSKGTADEWDDPLDEDLAPSRLKVIGTAVAQVERAKEVLAALIAIPGHSWQTRGYASHPWAHHRQGWRDRAVVRLRPTQRRLADAVRRVEENLAGLEDSRAAMAALVEQPVLGAFDAAAAALRRHYLFFIEPKRHRSAMPWTVPASTDAVADALFWVSRRTEEAVRAFVELGQALNRPTGQVSPWTSGTIEDLRLAAQTRPVDEVLAEVGSVSFRLRWDAHERMSAALHSAGGRPVPDVVDLVVGLAEIAAEPGNQQGYSEAVTVLLRSAAQRTVPELIEFALALTEAQQRVTAALRENDLKMLRLAGTQPPHQQSDGGLLGADSLFSRWRPRLPATPPDLAGTLLGEAATRTAPEITDLITRLHAANLDKHVDTIFQRLGWSAPVALVLDVVDELNAAARHDDARALLRSAGRRGAIISTFTFTKVYDERIDDAIRLVIGVRDRGHVEDLLALVGEHRDRPQRLLQAIAVELRRSSLPESVWAPLLQPAPDSAPAPLTRVDPSVEQRDIP